MDTNQVKVFLTAVRCRSFSETASRCFSSTASVCRTISKMEDEAGVVLFRRLSTGIELTKAGRAYYEGLSRIIEEHNELIEGVKNIERGVSEFLNAGILDGQTIDNRLRRAIMAFEDTRPSCRMNISRHSYGDLSGALDLGEIDIAFTLSVCTDGQDNVRALPISPLPTKIVLPCDHPLLEKENRSLADFAETTFLTTDDAPGRPFINSLFEPFGVFPEVVSAPDIGTLMLWLEAGRGVTLANPNHVMCNIPSLACVDVDDLPGYWFVAAWKDDAASPLVRAFIELLERTP